MMKGYLLCQIGSEVFGSSTSSVVVLLRQHIPPGSFFSFKDQQIPLLDLTPQGDPAPHLSLTDFHLLILESNQQKFAVPIAQPLDLTTITLNPHFIVREYNTWHESGVQLHLACLSHPRVTLMQIMG